MFRLSSKSLAKLDGVDAELVATIKRAIQLTSVDFTVVEGVRTLARQQELVRTGASQTMKSKHLIGRAVDLAPVVQGQVRWDWPLFFPIARAMKLASEETGAAVRWGGCWKLLSAIDDPERAVAEYARARRKAFMDGPHFELM